MATCFRLKLSEMPLMTPNDWLTIEPVAPATAPPTTCPSAARPIEP